jgi:trimeric autotransporter adhesin
VAGNERGLFVVHRVGPNIFPRQYAVSRWDGANWKQLDTNTFTTDFTRLFIGQKDQPYITGTFYYIGNKRASAVARWNGREWESLFEGNYQGLDGSIHIVFASAAHLGSVYIGGLFRAAGDLIEENIARWDGEKWQSVGGGTTGYPNQHVRTLKSAASVLYAGGMFTNIGGVTVRNVAGWNGSNWFALGGGLNDRVQVLESWNGTIVAGGRFTHSGETETPHIAQWNGTSWAPLGTGCDSSVGALASWRGELFVGGAFTNAGGVPAFHLARWDGVQWYGVGDGLLGNLDPDEPEEPRIIAMAANDQNLFVAGRFHIGGSILATNIARWDGTNWYSIGLPFRNPDDAVYALAVRDNLLYVGGIWSDESGKSVPLLRRWDGSTWTSLGSGMYHPASGFGSVHALTHTGGELFVGGRFSWAGGKASANIARWVEMKP